MAGAKKSLGGVGPAKLVAQQPPPTQSAATTPATTSPLPPVLSPAKPPTTSAGDGQPQYIYIIVTLVTTFARKQYCLYELIQ